MLGHEAAEVIDIVSSLQKSTYWNRNNMNVWFRTNISEEVSDQFVNANTMRKSFLLGI